VFLASQEYRHPDLRRLLIISKISGERRCGAALRSLNTYMGKDAAKGMSAFSYCVPSPYILHAFSRVGKKGKCPFITHVAVMWNFFCVTAIEY